MNTNRKRASNAASQKSSSFSIVSSRLTIFRDRDHEATTGSEILSAFQTFLTTEPETWFDKVQFIFKILAFCLGPGNIWKFPEDIFTYGSATYFYLYVVYTWVFCVPLLVFEISLSQYSANGFARIFYVSPLMEGVTLAISIYCATANFVYSLTFVYAMRYIYSAFHLVLPHSYCSEILTNLSCETNYTHQSNTPESVYFVNYLLVTPEPYNWQNATVFFILWFTICIFILFGLMDYSWMSIGTTFIILIGLLFLFIVTCTNPGASQGFLKILIPTKKEIVQISTWVYPIENSILTLNLGAGPLTLMWSASKIRNWSDRDCLWINIFAFLSTSISCFILFCASGVIAKKLNKSVDHITNNDKGMHIFVVTTQFFNTLKPGLSNFILIIYFAIIAISCCYSLVEYTKIILFYIESYHPVKRKIQRFIIIFLCVGFFIFYSSLGVTMIGYPLMIAFNKNFMGSALLIIIFFELVIMVYCYGLNNFCDDVEFSLGFTPRNYYQIVWVILPVIILIFLVMNVVVNISTIDNNYDIISLCCTFIFTLGPVIGWIIYKKSPGIRKRFHRLFRRHVNTGPPETGFHASHS